MIKIAILGLGTVGTGVVKVVEANTVPIQHKLGQPLSVKTALVRKLRADPYQHLMTENFREIEHDGEIRVVVETIGGAKIALDFTTRALKAGKSVVTSNKELVATHGYELLQLAKEHNVSYLFEASVGGGIPILRPMSMAATIRPRPIRRPGTTPATNRSVMEASAMEPYTTKVMDGGMTTPIAPPAAISAQENEAG